MATRCGVGLPNMAASVEPRPPFLISPNTAEAASVLAHMSGRVSYSGYYLPSPPASASPAPALGSPWVGPCPHTPQSAATHPWNYHPRELFRRPSPVVHKPTGNVLCREEKLQSVQKPCVLPKFYSSSPPATTSVSSSPLDRSAGFPCYQPQQLHYQWPYVASSTYSPIFAQPQQPHRHATTPPHYNYSNSYSQLHYQQHQWANFCKPTVLTDKELLQTISCIAGHENPSNTTTTSENSPGIKRTREADVDGSAHAPSSKVRRKCDVTETDPSRPYRCNFCKKSFRQHSTLTTHRRIHTGERPYSCAYCDRRFGDYSTKVKHQRTHTGSKPYDCFVCHVRFSQSGNMWRHLETVHRIDRKLFK